ncbi:golgin subfamily A member 6-like protein 7 [Ptychodera flava]|uniref:golgin subfamily A member 6-like protein 7 n=1 Tax=Ptychodera flava TaxID=63121 RepID=UPI00396A3AAF
MDSHWLRVCVLCCVIVLAAKNTAVLGQVEDEDVCEEHYKRCQDENYCSYMFDIRRQTDESCPEFSQLQTNLRDIQNRIQKQADTLEEAIVDFEEHKQGQFDLYEKLQEQQQQLWVQSEKLERHWQWIERQQKQIDIANDLIGEWHAHVEEMWDHMEGQSWVQQLRYQVERQQYDFKVLQQQVTAQQQEMDEQQDDWEKQQSSMWSDMQDWLMDHQNSLIESIKLAQEPWPMTPSYNNNGK